MTGDVAALSAELDRLADQGRSIELWWRDDDAVAATPALDRLLALAQDFDWPLSLAVIPSLAQPSLAERIRHRQDVTVLVHGWRHANHAAPGERSTEFGAARPKEEPMRELSAGLDRIRTGFGSVALPVFVPPWNRIAPGLTAELPRLGFRALSCFGEPEGRSPVARLDTHLDPVDWRGSRSLAQGHSLVAQWRKALARGATRLGLLTHHLMFDDALWRFSEALASLAVSHPAVRPIGLPAALALNVAPPQPPARATVVGEAA